MKKQTLKQRKALRSEAAKRGWATRIARQRQEVESSEAEIDRNIERWRQRMDSMQNVAYRPSPASWSDVSGIPDILRGAPPKPSLWQRIKGWFA